LKHGINLDKNEEEKKRVGKDLKRDVLNQLSAGRGVLGYQV